MLFLDFTWSNFEALFRPSTLKTDLFFSNKKSRLITCTYEIYFISVLIGANIRGYPYGFELY